MNTYTPPQVAELGDLHSLTGIFGTSSRADVLVNTNGDPVTLPGVQTNGSIDACPTQNPGPDGSCVVNTP